MKTFLKTEYLLFEIAFRLLYLHCGIGTACLSFLFIPTLDGNKFE